MKTNWTFRLVDVNRDNAKPQRTKKKSGMKTNWTFRLVNVSRDNAKSPKDEEKEWYENKFDV